MASGHIDAHHHLWNYSPPGPAWMGEGMEVLRRDFLVDTLRKVTRDVGIIGTIVIETKRSNAETRWLSSIANSTDLICGVVGWASLTEDDPISAIEDAAALPKIKGLRHPIHDEEDDLFVLREDFNRSIAELKMFDLRYDLLIFEKHLPQTIQFVDRHPNQIFVLDHIGKPRIREGHLEPWRGNIRKLALRENVYCKLSGMATEADWQSWSNEDLLPYFDAVLEAFSPSRLMFGSDWPVSTLASSYRRWFDFVQNAITRLSQGEQDRVLARTAVEAYGLATP